MSGCHTSGLERDFAQRTRNTWRPDSPDGRGPRSPRNPRTSANDWFSDSAGRLKLEGDFACMDAVSTDSPHACQGGTRCPSTIAVDPPTIIGGVNSLCGTRARQLVYHGRLGYRCTGLVGERPVSNKIEQRTSTCGTKWGGPDKARAQNIVMQSQNRG